MKTNLAVIVALAIVVASLVTIQTVMAKGTSYQTGYDHGCDDAKIYSLTNQTKDQVIILLNL